MSKSAKFDRWAAGDAYETYMGRWSRQIACDFLDWLEPAPDADWIDVGCGTGALTDTILDRAAPNSVLGIDPSDGFIKFAKKNATDDRIRFAVCGAEDLPAETGEFDIAVSGLAVNFFPDIEVGLREMIRVVRPGGRIAFYVWDYPGGGMGFINTFWKAAASIDPNAAALDEGTRFPDCTPDGLTELCATAGLSCEVTAIEREARFSTFDVFWDPFTRGAGPAPGYVAKLDEAQRARLIDELKSAVGEENIILPARAWAVHAPTPGP